MGSRIIAYNTLGAQNRVIIAIDTEAEGQAALDEGSTLAAKWNATETRRDMVVHFVCAGGFIRAIADLSPAKT